MKKRNAVLAVLLVIQVIIMFAISAKGLAKRSDQLIVGGLVATAGVTTAMIYHEPRAARKNESAE